MQSSMKDYSAHKFSGTSPPIWQKRPKSEPSKEKQVSLPRWEEYWSYSCFHFVPLEDPHFDFVSSSPLFKNKCSGKAGRQSVRINSSPELENLTGARCTEWLRTKLVIGNNFWCVGTDAKSVKCPASHWWNAQKATRIVCGFAPVRTLNCWATVRRLAQIQTSSTAVTECPWESHCQIVFGHEACLSRSLAKWTK